MALPNREVLVAFYHATDGPSWGNSFNWNTNANLCEWYGVKLDAEGRVVELSLPRNKLRGCIPPELGQLASLERVDLAENELAGAIPPELGRLATLKFLSLEFNQLIGFIPAELGCLTALEHLNLAWNKLRSPIPTELGRLKALVRLSLEGNNFAGPMPPELSALAIRYLGWNTWRGAQDDEDELSDLEGETTETVSRNVALLRWGNLCCRGLERICRGLKENSRFDGWLGGSRRRVGIRAYHTEGSCREAWRSIILLKEAESRGVHWENWPAQRTSDVVSELCYLDLLTATTLGDSWLGTAIVASVAATGSYRLFHLAVSVLSSGIARMAGVNPLLKPSNDEAEKNNLKRARRSIGKLMQDRSAACCTGLLTLSAYIAELEDETSDEERGGDTTPCYARGLGEYANLNDLPRWADLSRSMNWMAELGCVVRYSGSRIYITSWAQRDSHKALMLDVDGKGSVRHLSNIRLVDPAWVKDTRTSTLPEEHLQGRLLVGVTPPLRVGRVDKRRKLLGLEVKSGPGLWLPRAKTLRSLGEFARDRDVVGWLGDRLLLFSQEVETYQPDNLAIREIVEGGLVYEHQNEVTEVINQRRCIGFGGHTLNQWLVGDVEHYWAKRAPGLRACIRASRKKPEGHRWRRLLRELFVLSLGTPAVTSDICEMILRTCALLLEVTADMVKEERAKKEITESPSGEMKTEIKDGAGSGEMKTEVEDGAEDMMMECRDGTSEEMETEVEDGAEDMKMEVEDKAEDMKMECRDSTSEEMEKAKRRLWILKEDCSVRNMFTYRLWKWKELLGISGYLLMELDSLIDDHVPQEAVPAGDCFCRSVMRRDVRFHRYRCGELGNPVLLGISALSEVFAYDVKINDVGTPTTDPVSKEKHALRTLSVGVGHLMTQLLPTEDKSEDLRCTLVLPIESRAPGTMPEKARWGNTEGLSTINGKYVGAWLGHGEGNGDRERLSSPANSLPVVTKTR